MLDIPLTAAFTFSTRREPSKELLPHAQIEKPYSSWKITHTVPWSMKQLFWALYNYGYTLDRSQNYGCDYGIYTVDEMAHYLSRTDPARVERSRSPLVNHLDQIALIESVALAMRLCGAEYVFFKIVVDDNDIWKLSEGIKFFQTGQYDDIPPSWRERDFIKDTALDPTSKLFNFPHISVNNPGILAFTADDDKGRRDIQTPMKPGKYLKQFLGDKLNELYGENKANAIIAQMAAEFGNYSQPEKLKFASTADEIEYVYTHGPSSCMSHKAENFRGHEHPVRALAAGDLQVAYIERRKDQITARALVWPEKKVWTRIYGDQERIRPLLRNEGYRAGDGGCLDGAKLNLIENENHHDHFIMPYIDGHAWAKPSEDGTHFVISNKEGHVYLRNTAGHADNGFECFSCQKRGRTSERCTLMIGGKGRMVCGACYEKDTLICDYSGRRFPQADMVQMAWGGFWHRNYFRDFGFVCGFDGKRYSRFGDYDRPTAPRRGDCRVYMTDGTVWYYKNFAAHGKRTKDGRNITLDQWKAEDKTRMMKELEVEGQLVLEGMSPEELKKLIAAKRRREQRAAKRAREKADAEAMANTVNVYINHQTTTTSIPTGTIGYYVREEE